MKKAEELLRKTLTLNSKDYKFIQDTIDYRGEDYKNLNFENFRSMMYELFVFENSSQGHGYWLSVLNREDAMQEDLQNHSHE